MRRSLLFAVLVLATQGCVNLTLPPRACDGGDCLGADAESQVDAPSGATDASGADADAAGGPLVVGSACARADQCASNVCADGVCCATSCAGTCMSCKVKGTVGVCVPVAPGDDPDDECAAEDS